MGHTEDMDASSGLPFSYADIKPYAVPRTLEELRGPQHGIVTLPLELAWSGRREYDLDDDYDRVALYKVVLEEGQESDLRRLLNRAILCREWHRIFPARQVRVLWERRFPDLKHAA